MSFDTSGSGRALFDGTGFAEIDGADTSAGFPPEASSFTVFARFTIDPSTPVNSVIPVVGKSASFYSHWDWVVRFLFRADNITLQFSHKGNGSSHTVSHDVLTGSGVEHAVGAVFDR